MINIPRIGLMVARLQPLHIGHCKIIGKMIEECQTAIVCLGSAQISREKHDPWTVEERMEMLRNVYADRIKIVPLTDLGAITPHQWVDYIIEKIGKLGLKTPTDYYTGSDADAIWYRDYFAADWDAIENHTSKDFTGLERYYTTDCVLRRLHVMDRNVNPVPSATEIRTWFETRTNGWKEWVPAVNHDLVKNTYPEEFKVPEDISNYLYVRNTDGRAIIIQKPAPPPIRLIKEGGKPPELKS